MKTFQKALAVGVFAVVSGYATQAVAAPIFSFTEYAGFEAGDVAVAGYTGLVVDPFAPAIPVYSTMNWNDTVAGTQSYLNVTTYQGALAAETWTTISTLTHTNNVIRQFTDWADQDIWGRFRINDSDGGLTNRLDDDEAIRIALTETTNANCGPPNPIGTTCDDYFTFDPGFLVNPLFFTANDGTLWQAIFGFGNPVNAFVIGNTVYTGENGVSSIDLQVYISQVSSVPEPATLGMFGLGLLGLGLAKRRKQNS